MRSINLKFLADFPPWSLKRILFSSERFTEGSGRRTTTVEELWKSASIVLNLTAFSLHAYIGPPINLILHSHQSNLYTQTAWLSIIYSSLLFSWCLPGFQNTVKLPGALHLSSLLLFVLCICDILYNLFFLFSCTPSLFIIRPKELWRKEDSEFLTGS